MNNKSQRMTLLAHAIFYVGMLIYLLINTEVSISGLPLFTLEFVVCVVVTFLQKQHHKIAVELLFVAFVFRVLTVREFDECLLSTCEVDMGITYIFLGALTFKWIQVVTVPSIAAMTYTKSRGKTSPVIKRKKTVEAMPIVMGEVVPELRFNWKHIT